VFGIGLNNVDKVLADFGGFLDDKTPQGVDFPYRKAVKCFGRNARHIASFKTDALDRWLDETSRTAGGAASTIPTAFIARVKDFVWTSVVGSVPAPSKKLKRLHSSESLGLSALAMNDGPYVFKCRLLFFSADADHTTELCTIDQRGGRV
jgi:hypothetical protein